MTSFLRTRKDRHPKPENKTRLHTTYAHALPDNDAQMTIKMTIEKSESARAKELIETVQFGNETLDQLATTHKQQLQQMKRKTGIVS